MSQRTAVIGAGIAGLAAAYELTRNQGCAVTVFEAAPRAGGMVETLHHDGFVIECGPDSWVTERRDAQTLAEELGLGGQIIHSNEDRRRTWLASGRTLAPLPEGMRFMVPTRWAPVLESPLFSWQARLAYLREPRRAAELRETALRRAADFDEPVHAFVERHFGAEVAETVAGPLLGGIFGGDARRLSAAATLAPFVQMEREQGSLVTATMARARAQQEAGASQPLFTTLRGGLQLLVDSLVSRLPPRSLRLNTRVKAVGRSAKCWRVECAGIAPETFDDLVLALPAHSTAALLRGVLPQAAALLPQETSSAIVVALCFGREESARMRVPRGFGFLNLRRDDAGDEPELLAGTFMHHKFDSRAPENCILLRGFFGGAAAARMLGWPDDAIAGAAQRHLSRLLGPLPTANHLVIRRWPRSLPQYTVGHGQRVIQMEQLLHSLPHFAVTGNAFHGVGLPAVIHHARNAALAIRAQR